MVNFTTLFFLVNQVEGPVENDEEDLKTDAWLIEAPEAAVRNVIGFARSYSLISSQTLEYIDLYEN
ncbi:MAG: hypothetical protein J7L89_02305 [Bacteroidales bacterium]|nr:hypothetical protein [Bacteroidales bacterium]